MFRIQPQPFGHGFQTTLELAPCQGLPGLDHKTAQTFVRSKSCSSSSWSGFSLSPSSTISRLPERSLASNAVLAATKHSAAFA